LKAPLDRIGWGRKGVAESATPAPAPAPAAEAPKKEVAAPKPATVSTPAPAAKAKALTDNESRVTRKKMTPLRRKIAQHLVNAQQTAAILTTFNEVDMTAVMSLRKSVQEDFVKKHGVKLGFMSLFTKAVVQALKDVPSINASIEENEIVQNHFYDVGIAIGTEKGLMVPVVRDCDQKSFAQIEKDIIGYATKAKEGRMELSDLMGGVFTISNGGVYGSLLSTPILNPPQSGILGMHTIQQRPMAINGEVKIRPMMYLAMSYDHRLVDGKEAVTFLIKVKDCLENPTRMMLEM
jgi:2-oxoglutarate dehydrogenase E2 component (dihydrolipoamide succinyltransferase)